jgi:hypothetical protein
VKEVKRQETDEIHYVMLDRKGKRRPRAREISLGRDQHSLIHPKDGAPLLNNEMCCDPKVEIPKVTKDNAEEVKNLFHGLPAIFQRRKR